MFNFNNGQCLAMYCRPMLDPEEQKQVERLEFKKAREVYKEKMRKREITDIQYVQVVCLNSIAIGLLFTLVICSTKHTKTNSIPFSNLCYADSFKS